MNDAAWEIGYRLPAGQKWGSTGTRWVTPATTGTGDRSNREHVANIVLYYILRSYCRVGRAVKKGCFGHWRRHVDADSVGDDHQLFPPPRSHFLLSALTSTLPFSTLILISYNNGECLMGPPSSCHLTFTYPILPINYPLNTSLL